MDEGGIGVVSVVASTTVALVALAANVATTIVDRRHQRQLAEEAREAVARDQARNALLELTEWVLRLEDYLTGMDREAFEGARTRDHDLGARLVLFAPRDVAEALAVVDAEFLYVDDDAWEAAEEVVRLVNLKERAIAAGEFETAVHLRDDEKKARRKMDRQVGKMRSALASLHKTIQSHALTLQPSDKAPTVEPSRRWRRAG